MKITRFLASHRNDFDAELECEHCGGTHELHGGYNDSYYHSRVMPSITCMKCGKNRAGEVPAQANPQGHVSV